MIEERIRKVKRDCAIPTAAGFPPTVHYNFHAHFLLSSMPCRTCCWICKRKRQAEHISLVLINVHPSMTSTNWKASYASLSQEATGFNVGPMLDTVCFELAANSRHAFWNCKLMWSRNWVKRLGEWLGSFNECFMWPCWSRKRDLLTSHIWSRSLARGRDQRRATEVLKGSPPFPPRPPLIYIRLVGISFRDNS